MITGCCWAVEWSPALAAIEGTQVPTAERDPNHAIFIDIGTKVTMPDVIRAVREQAHKIYKKEKR